ncbi:MAG: hypothetical protein LQ339_004751 [Xanthoria mediterranea]|nr:MAG: hypothetical protein LQ339_004751 [Xanthoria mediterranea]
MFDFFTPSKPRNTHAPSQSSPYSTHPKDFLDNGTDPSSLHQHTPPAVTHDLSSSPRGLITQQPPPTRSTSKLSDWFTGESDPFTFTIIPSPTKEKLDPIDEMTSLPDRTGAAIGKPPIITRFSFFASKQPLQTPADVHDAWHDLDIKTALSPDPSCPSAFKDLQRNAEGLLSRLQTAYKQRSQVLHDVLAEKETLAEEREGAEMRSRHLKLQLDDMTAKLVKQDQAMMDLVDQLAQEKLARREVENTAREMDPGTRRSSKSRTSTASEMSIESAAESLFSQASPTMSMSSVSTQSLNQCRDCRTKISPIQSRNSEKISPIKSRDSEAWGLVNILTLENKGLKARLGQLESTVEDCLDMVKGLF